MASAGCGGGPCSLEEGPKPMPPVPAKVKKEKEKPIDWIVGAKVTVMSRTRKKRRCTIVMIEGDRVKIHYDGSDVVHDKWLPKDSERISEDQLPAPRPGRAPVRTIRGSFRGRWACGTWRDCGKTWNVQVCDNVGQLDERGGRRPESIKTDDGRYLKRVLQEYKQCFHEVDDACASYDALVSMIDAATEVRFLNVSDRVYRGSNKHVYAAFDDTFVDLHYASDHEC